MKKLSGFGFVAATVAMALVFAGCPDGNGNGNGNGNNTDNPNGDPPVISVISVTGGETRLYFGDERTLGVTRTPAESTAVVSWTSSPEGAVQFREGAEGEFADTANGLSVTLKAGNTEHNAVTVTATVAEGNTRTMAFSVEEDESGEARLLFFQLGTAPAGSTTELPERNAQHKYVITNKMESAGWNGQKGPSLANATFVYLNKQFYDPDDKYDTGLVFSARIRTVEAFHADNTGSGVIMGIFDHPKRPETPDIRRVTGLRYATSGELRAYSTQANSADNQNASGAAINATPPLTGTLDAINPGVGAEYIVEITREGKIRYVIVVKDPMGVELGRITRTNPGSGNIVVPENPYLGFIINGATVEISQIKVTHNDDVIFETPASDPTTVATTVTGVTVTGPSSVEVGATSTAFNATVQGTGSPSQAVTWTVGLDENGTTADISEFATWDATARTLKGEKPGTVYVTATSDASTTHKKTVKVEIKEASGITWTPAHYWNFTDGKVVGWTDQKLTGAPANQNDTNGVDGTVTAIEGTGVTMTVKNAGGARWSSLSTRTWTGVPAEARAVPTGIIQPNGTHGERFETGNIEGPIMVRVRFAASGNNARNLRIGFGAVSTTNLQPGVQSSQDELVTVEAIFDKKETTKVFIGADGGARYIDIEILKPAE